MLDVSTAMAKFPITGLPIYVQSVDAITMHLYVEIIANNIRLQFHATKDSFEKYPSVPAG